MSSTAGLRSLRTAIEEQTFAPAYLLFGEDDFRKGDALRQLIDAAVEGPTRDFNLEIVRGPEVDAETLGSALSMPPMMAARRAVVIRDVGGLKKEAKGALDRYLERPAADTVLVLVVPAGGKYDKGLSERATPIEFEPLTGAKLPKWIAHYVEHNLHASITPGAMTLLQDSVGTDLGSLAIELEKLVSYSAGGPIDEAAVTAIVGIRRGETLGGLLDAVALRDTSRAAALIPGVLEQPKMSGVLLVMALTTQMLAITYARARRDRGMPAAAIKGELFSLLKSAGGVYVGRSWGEAVETWSKAVDRWSGPELDEIVVQLRGADFALKESRVSSEEQVVLSLILSLAARPKRGTAA
jgi:DNA polymerase-3 subunit delta